MDLRVRMRARDEQGAVAVEFALVVPILLLIVFGVLQYGLYFNDYLQARQAVREGARAAAVDTFAACGGATDNAQQILCHTESLTSPVSGPVAVHVVVPASWVAGSPVVVCETVKTADISGLLPMPHDGYVVAKTQMSIEQDSPVATGFTSSGVPSTSQTDPTGANWSWCS